MTSIHEMRGDGERKKIVHVLQSVLLAEEYVIKHREKPMEMQLYE